MMKVLVIVAITVVTVFAAQDSGVSSGLNGLLKSVTDTVGKATAGIVPKELQADTFCPCLRKAYEDKEFTVCEGKGEKGFDVREWAKNIVDLSKSCTKLSIPGLDGLTSAIAAFPEVKLAINAKTRCECIYKEVKADKIPACRGKQVINLIELSRQTFEASQCKKKDE